LGAALACLFLLVVAGAPAPPALAGGVERRRGDSDAGSTYTVQPGDTLQGLAERFGVSLRRLMHDNGIQHPRDLYPGQVLAVPAAPLGAAPSGWQAQPLAWGEEIRLLNPPAGIDPMAVARANRLLLPTRALLGQRLLLPLNPPAHAVTADGAAPRVAAAVEAGVSLWDVLRLTPLPYVEGRGVWVPGAAPAPSVGLPDLLTDLSLAPQPAARGETAVLAVGVSPAAAASSAPAATCRVRYLAQDEACYGPIEDGRGTARYYALVGLPPLLAVGRYTVTLEVTTSPTQSVVLPLPLVVSAGRYDYERLDFSSSRQTLLDPARSQLEREKIAALRMVRSPERFWAYPFALPLQGSVTSYYGSRRSYGYGFGSFHGGTDYRAEVGDPVTAPAAGVVVLAEPLVVRGNAVMIDHGWGVVSGYWHLSRIDVAVGQPVAAGEILGAVGNTGLSTGPHLHWELWVNGVAVNPISWTEPDGPGAALGAAP
jgi:murein DD-endopeptidase MepM/ murein hydrolase activator NlpD